MKRLAIVLVTCGCMLIPASARADDGGWLDWLFRMDPQFAGIATDFHLLCISDDGQVMRNCEEYFGLRHLFGEELQEQDKLKFAKLRQEINLRLAYYRTHGDLYASNPGQTANAIKVLVLYAYHPDTHLVISAGGGIMPFYGADLKETRWSGIFTPISVRYYPSLGGCDSATGARAACGLAKGFFLQGESSWITRVPTPDLFVGQPGPTVVQSEWNTSVAFGWDFRRRHFGS